MKRFIAFYGATNSGLITREKAIEWAQKQLLNNNVQTVYIAEASEVVERISPTIEVKPFVLPEVPSEVLKAA